MKPATPLPWRIGDAGRSVFGPPNGEPSPQTVAPQIGKTNAAYIAHAANAYPKLVRALRTMNHMGGDERGGYCICPRGDGSAPDSKHASGCADVRSLLRTLGEIE